MNIDKYKKMIEEEIVESMIAYMKFAEEECIYNEKDVEKCKQLLINYLNELSVMENPIDKEIKIKVKKLVISLNKLNEKLDYTLIETEQRKSICEFINETAIDRGLQDRSEDITEEWREW